MDPPAAKELRLFGLSGWIVERFAARRRQLHDLRWEATRLREKSVIWSLLIITAANLVVFALLAQAALAGDIVLGQMVTYASAAVSTSMIAFGGLSWALDGAAAPVATVIRLQTTMGMKGALASGVRQGDGLPARSIRFRDVSFQYPNARNPVLQSFDLTIPADSSLAIVGQNGAGKTTLAKLICRLYDPSSGTIEIDGIDLGQSHPTPGARVLPLCSRISCVSSGPSETTLLLPAAPPMTRSERRWRRPGQCIWRISTHHWPKPTSVVLISPAANGNGAPWHARCVPSAQGLRSSCWMNRRRS